MTEGIETTYVKMEAEAEEGQAVEAERPNPAQVVSAEVNADEGAQPSSVATDDMLQAARLMEAALYQDWEDGSWRRLWGKGHNKEPDVAWLGRCSPVTERWSRDSPWTSSFGRAKSSASPSAAWRSRFGARRRPALPRPLESLLRRTLSCIVNCQGCQLRGPVTSVKQGVEGLRRNQGLPARTGFGGKGNCVWSDGRTALGAKHDQPLPRARLAAGRSN